MGGTLPGVLVNGVLYSLFAFYVFNIQVLTLPVL
jgi:hypothetical protein